MIFESLKNNLYGIASKMLALCDVVKIYTMDQNFVKPRSC